MTGIAAAPDSAGSDGTGPVIPTAPIDQAGAEAATSTATGFMRAYSQTQLPKQAWFDGIRGFLTDFAATGYQYNDPATMASFTLSGDPTLEQGAMVATATCDVPTSTGVYQVIMVRPSGAGNWAVSRAIPPAGQN
ncbi:hypothetical protein D4765_13920 [Subtercola vilae]|uniref:DUF4864 domain-containing protein n=1 Tax=Subtercola vilae TaxID=2056433 RepID=A0A4T2BVF6_9MICO|nr:hypothetical protein D4765_13920 [Subtercola vilae]